MIAATIRIHRPMRRVSIATPPRHCRYPAADLPCVRRTRGLQVRWLDSRRLSRFPPEAEPGHRVVERRGHRARQLPASGGRPSWRSRARCPQGRCGRPTRFRCGLPGVRREWSARVVAIPDCDAGVGQQRRLLRMTRLFGDRRGVCWTGGASHAAPVPWPRTGKARRRSRCWEQRVVRASVAR